MAEFDILLFYGIASIVAAFFILFGNGLTLIAFWKEKSLRSGPSNNLIIALTLNDFLYGCHILFLVGIPYSFFTDYPYGEYGCMAAVICNNIFVVGNLLLLAITVDRILLVALKYSTYVKFQTSRRVAIEIAICYIIVAAIVTTELGLWNFAKKFDHVAKILNFEQYCLSPARRLKEFGLLLSFGFYVIPIVSIFALNIVFFALLIRKIKNRSKIGDSTMHSQVDTMRRNQATSLGDKTDDRGSDSKTNSTRNRYIKPAVTLGVLVVAMAISNIPYCTYIIVASFCESCKSPTLIRICLLFTELNSLLDPLFYALTQRKITEFYRKKLQRMYASLGQLWP